MIIVVCTQLSCRRQWMILRVFGLSFSSGLRNLYFTYWSLVVTGGTRSCDLGLVLEFPPSFSEEMIAVLGRCSYAVMPTGRMELGSLRSVGGQLAGEVFGRVGGVAGSWCDTVGPGEPHTGFWGLRGNLTTYLRGVPTLCINLYKPAPPQLSCRYTLVELKIWFKLPRNRVSGVVE